MGAAILGRVRSLNERSFDILTEKDIEDIESAAIHEAMTDLALKVRGMPESVLGAWSLVNRDAVRELIAEAVR